MSLFGRGPDAPPAAASPPAPLAMPSFAIDRARMFDLALTGRLADLAAARGARDDRWHIDFFAAAWNASIALPSPEAFIGPDGFPYLRLDIPAAGPFDSNALANVAGPCVEAGIGAALFATPDAADPFYVLPMGVLESLLHYGDWRGDPQDLAEQGATPAQGSVTLDRGQQVMTGSPSADYLPAAAARALHRWLVRRGLAEPRVQLMVSPAMRPTRTLVVNVRRDAFRDDAEAADFSQRVLWHLPPSRSITLLPDGWDEAAFTPLTTMF